VEQRGGQRRVGLALLAAHPPAQEQQRDVVGLQGQRLVQVGQAFGQLIRLGIEAPARGVGPGLARRQRDSLVEALEREVGVALLGGGAAQLDKPVRPARVGGGGLLELLQRALGIAKLQKQPPALVEHALYFDDWRDVDGIKFPHAFRRAIAGSTVEEWAITKVKVNPKIDPKKFATAQ